MYALTAAALLATATLLPQHLLLGWVTYALYFHPLYKYLGSLLAKLTRAMGLTCATSPTPSTSTLPRASTTSTRAPVRPLKSKVYSLVAHRAPNTSTIRYGSAGRRLGVVEAAGESGFRKSVEAWNRFVRSVTGVVTLHVDKEKNVLEDNIPDLFSRLRDAHDPDRADKFTVDENGLESTTFIVAGSDTSSTSLCSALFYLAHNPATRTRATEDARAKFAHYGDICAGPALYSCQYLRACIDEAFRMSPLVGTCLYRELVSQDATIDCHAIPAGYNPGTGIYAIHHSSTYFSDPFVYRPGRWIPGREIRRMSRLKGAILF
ncbi:hypothetical protein DL770_000179 [Monosporascus sp. CRB-9-2]|nr:hypothetical protein DL770_000179 [Monosporascus sp. CRB-9-2]